jgi:DNA-directed RNA polymerase subunit RPC12/RpoP
MTDNNKSYLVTSITGVILIILGVILLFNSVYGLFFMLIGIIVIVSGFYLLAWRYLDQTDSARYDQKATPGVICPNCGSKLDQLGRFCPSCGYRAK